MKKINKRYYFDLLFRYRDYLFIILLSCIIGYAVLLLAYGEYSSSMYLFYINSVKISVMNIFPVILINLFLYSIFKRAWISIFVGGGLITILSIVNYYKLTFRDDPLFFEDMFLAKEGAMLGISKFDLFVDYKIIIVILVWLACVCFSFKIKFEVSKKHNYSIIVFSVGLCVFVLCCLNTTFYDSIHVFDGFTKYHPTENFTSKGFVYPFIHSIGNMFDLKPDGYTQENVEAILNTKVNEDISEKEKVHIISIMREAYLDFSKFNIEGLDQDVYSVYHSLKSESYSGSLITNVFAGGTIKTEQSFLTGNYIDKNYRTNTNSHLWYFRDQGYVVSGNHPFYEWFYNRMNVNYYLGFENYDFLEDGIGADSTAYYPEDFYLYEEIYSDLLECINATEKLFSFNVTVQSHGPYDTSSYLGNQVYFSGEYSNELINSMNNYLEKINDSDNVLMSFIRKIQDLNEPIIVLIFSDHLPWMGDNASYYDEMGINLDFSTAEGFINYYETEYLIWANQAAKDIFEHDFIGNGGTISPCYLMNVLFDLCEWKGSKFMQSMKEIMIHLPVVTDRGSVLVDGAVSDAIPDNLLEIYKKFVYLQYYWRTVYEE